LCSFLFFFFSFLFSCDDVFLSHPKSNDIWLHRDASLMPHNQACWSSWNFLATTSPTTSPASTPALSASASASAPAADVKQAAPASASASAPAPASGGVSSKVCCTYWLNRLQHLGPTGTCPQPYAPPLFLDLLHLSSAAHFSPTLSPSFLLSLHHPPKTGGLPVLITLNPIHHPSPALTISRFTLAHPTPTPAAIAAQSLVPSIQGVRGLYFAGAYMGYVCLCCVLGLFVSAQCGGVVWCDVMRCVLRRLSSVTVSMRTAAKRASPPPQLCSNTSPPLSHPPPPPFPSLPLWRCPNPPPPLPPPLPSLCKPRPTLWVGSSCQIPPSSK
jgi:hypothetical protein